MTSMSFAQGYLSSKLTAAGRYFTITIEEHMRFFHFAILQFFPKITSKDKYGQCITVD